MTKLSGSCRRGQPSQRIIAQHTSVVTIVKPLLQYSSVIITSLIENHRCSQFCETDRNLNMKKSDLICTAHQSSCIQFYYVYEFQQNYQFYQFYEFTLIPLICDTTTSLSLIGSVTLVIIQSSRMFSRHTNIWHLYINNTQHCTTSMCQYDTAIFCPTLSYMKCCRLLESRKAKT